MSNASCIGEMGLAKVGSEHLEELVRLIQWFGKDLELGDKLVIRAVYRSTQQLIIELDTGHAFAYLAPIYASPTLLRLIKKCLGEPGD